MNTTDTPISQEQRNLMETFGSNTGSIIYKATLALRDQLAAVTKERDEAKAVLDMWDIRPTDAPPHKQSRTQLEADLAALRAELAEAKNNNSVNAANRQLGAAIWKPLEPCQAIISAPTNCVSLSNTSEMSRTPKVDLI